MSESDIIRAWKDRRYRRGLSESQRGRLPEHPSGLVEVPDEQLGQASGQAMAEPTNYFGSMGCCDYLTQGTGPCGSCDCTVDQATCSLCSL